MELFQKKEPTTREGGPTALELIRYKAESSALELFQKKEPTTSEGGPSALELIRYKSPESRIQCLGALPRALPEEGAHHQVWGDPLL